MDHILYLYNTLSHTKEKFEPFHPPLVGLYVCGPTVYGDPHLGHARPAITFDLLYRYLTHLGFKVRYVRNITDVGHLEQDLDEGEDKIARQARIEKMEPMEVVQYYMNRYHDTMRKLNVLPPNIEPLASGHIIEQQELVKKLIDNGYAYESNGSVYFDVEKYNNKNHYGKLSGRKTEDLLAASRELEKQSDKRNPLDFALWKKAEPQHIMRWPSPWSDGFPGWHVECSVMSQKYLGNRFDIHGGGMDLLFPHHECEIAQTVASQGTESVKYWMHNNMVTLNGKKMGKSLGNSITLEEFITGHHKLLSNAYSPMTIRFFMLQAHYRSTLDFSNEALQAAAKGLDRLMEGFKNIDKIIPAKKSTINPDRIKKELYDAMNDDLNSPIAISHLFDGIRDINSVVSGNESLNSSDLVKIKKIYHTFIFDILGLQEEKDDAKGKGLLSDLINLLLMIRIDARKRKDFETADRIRDELSRLGVEVRDVKDGYEWKIN
ncbi:MAG: cysteinyl-tRNA synthetase [Bacteroides sp. SM23_62_1]|nr:MAG: cysteinyl-tRNA synthetase [Bacteroides sp. SM23_62_1]